MSIYNFNNEELYELISSKEEIDSDNDKYKLIIQEYKDLENNQIIRRTLRYLKINKFESGLSKNQISYINDRLKLKKFGKEVMNNKNNSVGKNDDTEYVFMEYNPEILKSKKSMDYLKKNKHLNETRPFHKQDKIIISEDYEKSFSISHPKISKYLWNQKELGKELIKDKLKRDSLLFDKNKSKTSLNKNLNSKNDIRNMKFTNTPSKKYMLPSMRRKEKDNNTGEITTLKLNNLPADITENILRDWIKKTISFRCKSTIPKNKKTEKYRDFAFLTFNTKLEAEKSFEQLQNKRIDYNVVGVEWAKY